MKSARFKRTQFQQVAVPQPDDTANGAAIREMRLKKGMTQSQLGNAIDVSDAHISALEAGNRSFSEDLFNRAKAAISRHRK